MNMITVWATFVIVQFLAFTCGFLFEMLGWIMNLITSPLGIAVNALSEWMSELRVQMHSETLASQLRVQANKAKAQEIVAQVIEGRAGATPDDGN